MYWISNTNWAKISFYYGEREWLRIAFHVSFLFSFLLVLYTLVIYLRKADSCPIGYMSLKICLRENSLLGFRPMHCEFVLWFDLVCLCNLRNVNYCVLKLCSGRLNLLDLRVVINIPKESKKLQAIDQNEKGKGNHVPEVTSHDKCQSIHAQI